MPEQNENDAFHMVQLRLSARRLAGLGKMLGLFNGRRRRVSTNYLVHCALGELFQEQAPKPFCVESAPRQIGPKAGRQVRVLGYAPVAREALEQLARGFASPAVYETCDWDTSASKPMPDAFPKGMRLCFELRACPVVRKSSAGQTSTGKAWKAGQELDAFLSHVWELDAPGVDVSREEVYRDWLERQFELRGGAELNAVGMDRFSIERMTRRSHGSGTGGRAVHTIQRPDVTLTGELTVTDSAAFTDLLKSGIGRHKSFGFGMLKIRRA